MQATVHLKGIVTMSETTSNTIIDTLVGFILNAISVTKAVSVAPFKDADEKKTVNLKINFNMVSLQSVVDAAIRSDVIRWQASARAAYDSLVDGSTVERNFSAPIRTVTITAEQMEQAYVAKLNAMTPEDRIAQIQKMMDEAQATVDALNEIEE
jgi:hypothetical protein